MHTWHWRSWNELPYLTCSILEPLAHGFFTQHYWAQQPADLTQVLHPRAQTYRVKQVHGNVVLTPTEVAAAMPGAECGISSEPPPADGLLTEQDGQAVWVCSADCVPILIADIETRQVAAVHAGWRGTAQKIGPQAIARLQQQGSHLANLRVALGPAIAGTVYQVSEAVAATVGASITAIDPLQVEAGVNALQQLTDSPLLEDSEPGRVRLDVRRVNALQLEQLGLAAEQVAIAPYCTFQETDYFFSYRRSGEKKAQWSGIVSGHSM